MLRIDRFRTVVLDFQKVGQIGQAFADEIFRVFARIHPGIDMQFINSNEEVLKMIRRAERLERRELRSDRNSALCPRTKGRNFKPIPTKSLEPTTAKMK